MTREEAFKYVLNNGSERVQNTPALVVKEIIDLIIPPTSLAQSKPVAPPGKQSVWVNGHWRVTSMRP